MKFTIDKAKYLDTKLVDEKSHPTFPLVIYNYTPECQFSKAWDDVTKMCRGLIVHKDTRDIIARPFSKFFNYEEHVTLGEKLPDEVPHVYAKFDGSLGILYWWNDEPYIATRGSFTSDQALWASEWIRSGGAYVWTQKLDKRYTYLFEIIYPENRIVVSYGDMKQLVLLAAIDTETGKTVDHSDTDFPFVGKVPFTSYEELKKLNTPNEEGFVLHYPTSDFRVKIKFDDYVKLHKIMTGLSQIGIWEMMRDGKNPISQEIPDEMHSWIKGIMDSLSESFFCIEEEASLAALFAKPMTTRKEQAEYIKKTRYPSIAFAMLDGKNYNPDIWRMIRPKGSVTFRKDVDA